MPIKFSNSFHNEHKQPYFMTLTWDVRYVLSAVYNTIHSPIWALYKMQKRNISQLDMGHYDYVLDKYFFYMSMTFRS